MMCRVESSGADMPKASMRPIVLVGGTASYSKWLAEWNSRAIAFATVQIPISAFWSERRMYNWKKVEVEKAKDFRQWQQALTARNAANSEYLQAKTRYLILTGRREEVNH